MKKRLLTLVILFLFAIPLSQAQNYDYLESATNTGSAITTNNSKDWSDVISVTIDLGSNNTDTKYVLITASINMRPAPFPLTNTGAREGNYNIYRSDLITDESGIIKRQIKALSGESDVQSWGVGTLVHIFDVSGLSGSKTYTLEHSNQGGVGNGRNVESNARLTAVALSTATNHYELSNDVKRLGETGVTTTSATYVAVTGLTTDAITLPSNGDVYVTASVNGKADGTAVAEYKLEYSTDDGSTWSDLGKPIKRSMVNTWDDGIVSLVGLLQDQDADNDFKFRLAHKRESGTATVTTHNCNLVAIALVHDHGGYFPAFYSEVGATGVDITGVSAPAANVTSTTFTAAADISSVGTNLYVNSQYLVSASGLNEAAVPPQRMRAGNQLYADNGTPVYAEEYFRYIPDNSNFGAGGFIGLMEDLEDEGSYTIGMEHQVAYISNPDGTENETLTTSEVILTGFQTYDQPVAGYWTGASTTAWGTAANWADVTVPTAPTNVYIPNVTNDPIISGTTLRECTTLEIASGATLDIEDDAQLTVSGAMTNNGTLTIESTASGTGSLIFGSGTPSATVQRYLSDNMWHIVTPVTTDVTVLDFHWFDTPQSWLLTHDESKLDDASWSYVTALSTALNVGQGYMVWLDLNTKSNATATMVGNLQSADFAPTLAFTDASHGFNLIGNPFSSAIDFDLGSWGSNTSGFVYVWDNAYNSGDYRISGTTLTDNIIPLGQGFFVDATSAGTFNIPVAARVHSTQAFYKSSNNIASADDYVRIQLDGNGYGNTVFVGFPDIGTSGMDYKGDARKLFSSAETPQLFAIENNMELCVNANKPLTEGESKTVPLHLIQIVDGEYSLTISDIDQLEYNSITLEDIKTGITQDLRTDPVYTFNASSSDAPERFLLHFKWSPDGLGQDLKQVSNIQIFSTGNEVCIRSTEEAINHDGTVIIYDMMGRVLLQQYLEKGELAKFPLSITNNYVVVKVVKDRLLKTEMVFIK